MGMLVKEGKRGHGVRDQSLPEGAQRERDKGEEEEEEDLLG